MGVEADDPSWPTEKTEEAFFLGDNRPVEDQDVVHSTCGVCPAVVHTAVR